jgi:hypothetical protein
MTIIWHAQAGVAGVTGANNNDYTRTNSYVYDTTLTIGQLTP